MKRLLVLSITILLIAFSSCRAQLLSGNIENNLGEALYIKFIGKIYIKETTENSFLILCNTSEISTQYFDKALVIKSETKLIKPALSSDDTYEIQIPESGRFAVIYNQTNEKIYFIGIKDDNVFNRVSQMKEAPELKEAIANEDCFGYGISFMNNLWDADKVKSCPYRFAFNALDYSNENDKSLRLSIPPEEGGEGNDCGSCSSGGPGAAACNMGGVNNAHCSVSCTAGYYACCKNYKCYCCKN